MAPAWVEFLGGVLSMLFVIVGCADYKRGVRPLDRVHEPDPINKEN